MPYSPRFLACLAFTMLPQDDGQPFHTTAGDEGGPTAWGITLRALSAYLRRPCSAEDLRLLPVETRDAFYHDTHWVPLAGDALPPGVDLMAFDGGVVAGVGTSARMLQEAVGAAPDGEIGPRTLAALRIASRSLVVSAMLRRQIAHYRACRGWREFGHGWVSRATHCSNEAIKAALAAAPPSTPATP